MGNTVSECHGGQHTASDGADFRRSLSSPNTPSEIRDLALRLSRHTSSLRRILNNKQAMPSHAPISRHRCKTSKQHRRVFRELLQHWNVKDIYALVEEYENLMTLKSFVQMSNKSRQYAATCRIDLGKLLRKGDLTDVDLVYNNKQFSCHKAVLASRSEYFRELFLKHRSSHCFYITSPNPQITHYMFQEFLVYIYSNSYNTQVLSHSNFNFLTTKFKCTRNFKEALNFLRFGDADFSDSILLFKNSSPVTQDVPVPLMYQCHKSVLCARSKFFSNYLKRKSAMDPKLTAPQLPDVSMPAWKGSEIVLDTDIVHPKYGRILMDALYLDTIDLRNIGGGGTSLPPMSSNESSAESTENTGKFVIEEAMELYVIAGLLDIPVLAQGCEDIILRRLSIETINKVLNWSVESHGSKFVYRQCIEFITEDFSNFCQANAFNDLSLDILTEVLRSDYVQASELEILKAVLRWGAHQRASGRHRNNGATEDEQESSPYNGASSADGNYGAGGEANSGGAPSSIPLEYEAGGSNVSSASTRSGWRLNRSTSSNRRKADAAAAAAKEEDRQLMALVEPLLALVRVPHVIPQTSQTFLSALQRDLIRLPAENTPDNVLENGDSSTGGPTGWVRSTHGGDYTRPRLFMPYFNEAKALLNEQLSAGLSLEQLRYLHDYRSKLHQTVPDNLYMVDFTQRSQSLSRARSCPQVHPNIQPAPSGQMSNSGRQSTAAILPVPDKEVLKSMIIREHELQNSVEVRQALAQTNVNKLAIQREIQKSVVREFGYPDDVIEVLQNPLDYYNLDGFGFTVKSDGAQTEPRSSASTSRVCRQHSALQRASATGMMTGSSSDALEQSYGDSTLPDRLSKSRRVSKNIRKSVSMRDKLGAPSNAVSTVDIVPECQITRTFAADNPSYSCRTLPSRISRNDRSVVGSCGARESTPQLQGTDILQDLNLVDVLRDARISADERSRTAGNSQVVDAFSLANNDSLPPAVPPRKPVMSTRRNTDKPQQQQVPPPPQPVTLAAKQHSSHRSLSSATSWAELPDITQLPPPPVPRVCMGMSQTEVPAQTHCQTPRPHSQYERLDCSSSMFPPQRP